MLLQAFDENARAHVELPRKMLNATALVKAAAADKFAFFGFGKEHVLCECFCFVLLDRLERDGVGVGSIGLRIIIRIGGAGLCLIEIGRAHV